MYVNVPLPTTLRPRERLLVRMEQSPWSALYRIGIGYLVLPVFYQLFGNDGHGWYLTLWFLAVLFLLRLLPAVFRKALACSQEVREIWRERRQIAKYHDSYQWQKLIWFGFGMVGYAVSSGNVDSVASALVGFCLIGGGLGVYFWRRRNVAESSRV